MSRLSKSRVPPPPLSTVRPSPAEIIVLYPNSGWKPGQPPPTPEAIAQGRKRSRLRAFAATLIVRLESDDPRMVQAARAALRELAGADHGPALDAPAADRESAQAAWRRWWEGQRPSPAG